MHMYIALFVYIIQQVHSCVYEDFMYTCICIHMYIYVYIYIYICTLIYVFTCMCI